MIRRSTWIAIGGLGAVVILALVLTQSGRPEAVLKPTPVPQALWSVPADEIAAITIEDRGEGRVLEFERSAEELWKVTRPVEGPADVAQVEQAASWLTSPSPRAQIYNVESVEQFGLVSPAYLIRILLVNGTQLEFSVGRETPTGPLRRLSRRTRWPKNSAWRRWGGGVPRHMQPAVRTALARLGRPFQTTFAGRAGRSD